MILTIVALLAFGAGFAFESVVTMIAVAPMSSADFRFGISLQE
jgi:hypothetical protein